jgi:hypothetical protein
MHELINNIYEMYWQMGIGINHHNCIKCKEWADEVGEKLIGPIPIMHIGKNFLDDKYKILFLGAVVYGWDDIIDWREALKSKKYEYIQQQTEETISDLFYNHSSKIYEVMRHFCLKFYGNLQEGFDKIAISNIIKCNTGSISDNIPAVMRYSCAHKDSGLEVAKREAEIISANHIVSLAGKKYNNYILEWNDAERFKIFTKLPHPAARVKLSTDNYAEEIINWILSY